MTQTYSPITSVRIKNFQSLEDSTLYLGQLSVLVGPGDAGKSAVLRALRAAFLNDASDDDIRHGAKKMEVALTFEDGVVIEWWKQKGQGGCYRMTDSAPEREFTKTGGAVPDEVAEYLGIGRIEVDATTELTPQLSDQHDVPFILWETGSKRARILGKATRLDMVVSAQMLCKKELDQTRRGAEEATTALADVEVRLEELPDYRAIEGELDEAEANLKTIGDNILLAGRARELADQIAEVNSRATAIDVPSLLKRVEVSSDALEVAARGHFLAQRIPEVTSLVANLGKRHADHQEALASFQTQLTVVCEEAGVCETCGGLLSHKECGG
jgi:DNA repair exonuclease SbcCD ATPase subunit